MLFEDNKNLRGGQFTEQIRQLFRATNLVLHIVLSWLDELGHRPLTKQQLLLSYGFHRQLKNDKNMAF